MALVDGASAMVSVAPPLNDLAYVVAFIEDDLTNTTVPLEVADRFTAWRLVLALIAAVRPSVSMITETTYAV